MPNVTLYDDRLHSSKRSEPSERSLFPSQGKAALDASSPEDNLPAVPVMARNNAHGEDVRQTAQTTMTEVSPSPGDGTTPGTRPHHSDTGADDDWTDLEQGPSVEYTTSEYEGYILTRAPAPRERPDWSRVSKLRLPVSSSEIARMNEKFMAKDGASVTEMFLRLNSSQQAVINRLIAERQEANPDSESVWNLEYIHLLTKSSRVVTLPQNTVACTKIVVLLRCDFFNSLLETPEKAKADETIDLAESSQKKKSSRKTDSKKAKDKHVAWEEPSEFAAGGTPMPAPSGRNPNTGASPGPYVTAYGDYYSYPDPYPYGRPYEPPVFLPQDQPAGPLPYRPPFYPPINTYDGHTSQRVHFDGNVLQNQDARQQPVFGQQSTGISARSQTSFHADAAGGINTGTSRSPQTHDTENLDGRRPHQPSRERDDPIRIREENDSSSARKFDAPVPSYNDAYRPSDRTPSRFSTGREDLGANSSTNLPDVSSNKPRETSRSRGGGDLPRRQEGESSRRESQRSDHTKVSSNSYGSSQSRVLNDDIWSSAESGDSTDDTSLSVDETWRKAARHRNSRNASLDNHRSSSDSYSRPRQTRGTDTEDWMKDFTRMPSDTAEQPVARASNNSRRRYPEPYWNGSSGEDGYQANRYPGRNRDSSSSWDRRSDPLQETRDNRRHPSDDYRYPSVRFQKASTQYESSPQIPGSGPPQRQDHDDLTKARKVSTASHELSQALQESVSSLLVSHISRHLREKKLSSWLWQSRALEQLDCLLSGFTILFAKRLSLPSMHARVISFIRTRRYMLADQLKRAVVSRDSTAPHIPPGTTNARLPTVPEHEDLGELSQGGSTWTNFLVNSTEFQWLLDQMRRLSLFFPTDFAYFDVRTKIAEFFEALPRGTDFRISLDWDPVTFLGHQFEQEDRDLSRAVAFCGSAKAAYATSVREYLDALWPNCGNQVLQCVKDACLSADRQSTGRTGGLLLEIHLLASKTFFAFSGDPASMLEAAEACVWLATACRENEENTSVAYCSAQLTDGEPYLRMTPNLEQAAALEDDTSGLCWMKMVSNPVIAHGYPVPIREHPDRQEGLETCAGLMTELSQANWATSYNGFPLLKGVVSALIPRYQVDTSVMWHFYLEQSKSRLSFNDALPAHDRAHAIEVDMDSLCEHRHFIGIWTSDAQIMTGRRDRPDGTLYDIDYSDCKAAKEYTCSLSNVSIAAGKFINLGMSFVIGKKDRTPAFSRNAGDPYELQVQNVSELNIVLYSSDSRDRRAWMIDGASAVLHLARAFMTAEGARYISKGALESLSYPTVPGGKEAAMDALIQNQQKRIVLYENTEDTFETIGTHTHAPAAHVDSVNKADAGIRYEHKASASTWTYANLVASLCQVLEAMHDKLHQLSYHPPELPLQARWKKTLLPGWDFKDLLTRRGPYKPRMAELSSNAENWVKFVSRQNYVVLLASTFGEIIRPMFDCGPCSRTLTVPTGEDLLTVPLPILSSLSKRWKDQSLSQGYLQIAEDTFWLGFAPSISKCVCLPGCNCTCAIISHFSRTASHAKHAVVDEGITLALLRSNPLHAAIIGGGSNKLRKALPRNSRKVVESPSRSQQTCGHTHDSGYATLPPTPGATSSFPTPNTIHQMSSLETVSEVENGLNHLPGRNSHRTSMLDGEDYKMRVRPPDTSKELKPSKEDLSNFTPSPDPILTEDDKADSQLDKTLSTDRLHVSMSQTSLLTLARRCPILHPVMRELQREVSADSGDASDRSHTDKGNSGLKFGRRLRKVTGRRDLIGVDLS